jgi:oxalate decarboxylase/phosphoglucose isomerase-like protein (cupin superfamily)
MSWRRACAAARITCIPPKRRLSSSSKVGARCAWPASCSRSSAGDVAFLPPGPDYPHQIINTSDAPLKYLSISTRARPEIVEYPDSGKYLAMSGLGGQGFSRMARVAPDLDYWEGEP